MTSIHILKLWLLDLPILKRWFLKRDIKFNNVMLDSENVKFIRFQLFDA